jgi:hypothetical protein
VALIAGLTALIGMLVMRVAASGDVRRGIAVCVLVLAVAAAFLAALDATALADRFSGSEQRSRLAREIARETGEPYDEVRRLLERTHDLEFPVQTQAGIWIAVLGGLVAAGGAVASLAWARSAEGRSLTATPGPDTSSGSPRPQP